MNRKHLLLVAGLALFSNAALGWQSWDTSPMNWSNSSMNWENSPMNWSNSPMNWQNSTMNPNRHGVYSAEGDAIGYTTVTPSGTVNVWTNDGTRLGYGSLRR